MSRLSLAVFTHSRNDGDHCNIINFMLARHVSLNLTMAYGFKS